MPLALEITLILVLVALAVGLLPLFHQLRLTAKGLNAFLLSTTKDLSQIAEDVHASRLRMDHLAGTLQLTLVEISVFAKSVGEVGTKVKELHTEFRNSLESTTRIVGSVMGGIGAVLAFLKNQKSPETPEQEHHHERT
ncbi:MAG: hypothetical protein IPP58_14520 [Holophagaceae bacterium]|uniref:DUF948 domain-containing protein n=1 Tax=Candidatus Geothrix skivensis TaxID=2954439 RepID=A0A9D7XIV4_9BACT|nr:hypothetical protein [Candidatus Geothrix skivensis]